MTISFLTYTFQKGKFHHRTFNFLEQSKYDFIFKYLMYTRIPEKIPIYSKDNGS